MIDQLLVSAFGAPALYMSQSKLKSQRKWAVVFGLIAQVGRFIATARAGQWPLFVMCFLYTHVWLVGLYNYWIKPE